MKKENINITWTRGLACVMVVGIHVTTLGNSPGLLGSIRNFLLSFCSVGLMLFAMISGYLLFDKGKEPSLNLALKRFWSIFKIIAYFSTVYYLYDTLRGQGYYLYPSVFLKLNANHLWYLFTILPIYTLSAYITLPRAKSRNFYLGFLAIACCFFFLTEMLEKTSYNVGVYYSWPKLFIYMIVGFILGQLRGARAWPFFAAYGILAVVGFLTSGPSFIHPNLDHHDFFMFFQTLTFFAGMMRLNTAAILSKSRSKGIHSVFSLVSKYSIGIYGWHYLILFSIKSISEGFGLSGRYVFLLSFIGTLLCSLLISIADTWFWKRVRSFTDPLWQKISAHLQKITFFQKNP